MGKGSRNRAAREEKAAAFRLTPAQEKAVDKAMRDEINRQILEKDKEYYHDMNAAVLWVLYETFGFGEKRLRRFFDAFTVEHEKLRKRYEPDEDTNAPLCRYLLKERVGVDIEAWEKELEQNAG